jgi:hypothetical protein
MTSTDVNLHKPSYWQLIFLQSKVNGATYNGEALPGRTWEWPKNTYLQRRLERHKYLHDVESSTINDSAASYRRPIMRTIPIPSPRNVLVRGPESGLAWIPA